MLFLGPFFPSVSFMALIIMMKIAPRICPPVQFRTDETSGLAGHVTSTRYSKATGTSEKDAAPRIARMIYGAGKSAVGGAKMKAK